MCIYSSCNCGQRCLYIDFKGWIPVIDSLLLVKTKIKESLITHTVTDEQSQALQHLLQVKHSCLSQLKHNTVVDISERQHGDGVSVTLPKVPKWMTRNECNIKVQYFYSCLMNLSCSSILEKYRKYIFIKHHDTGPNCTSTGLATTPVSCQN